MSFNPIAGWAVANLRSELGDNPSVMELGNQRLTVDDPTFDRIIELLQPKAEKLGVNISDLKSLIGLEKDVKLPKTEFFYKALGFSSYQAIDVNSKYGSLMMDLNKDLQTDYQYTDQFDFVTNNGTGEHLFNQYQVLKNAHDLTKPGGMMMHIMPFVNWVNHGFFNFQPILYVDLASANNYELVKLSFSNRFAYEINVDLDGSQKQAYKNTPAPKRSLLERAIGRAKRELAERTGGMIPPKVKPVGLEDSIIELKPKRRYSPLAVALEDIKRAQDNPNIVIVAALRKTSDAPFQMPMQGKYVGDIKAKEIQGNYRSQTNVEQETQHSV